MLLVARAIADGSPPEGVMGAIHGYQPGSWLVAAAVAPLLALGVPDGIAAQIVLLGVGLITAAVVAGVATTWTRTPRGAAVASGHRP